MASKRVHTRNNIRLSRFKNEKIGFILKDYKILEIVEGLEENITNLVKVIDEECSSRDLENVSNFIHGKRKDFSGKNKNDERKGFIINYIIEKQVLADQEAKFFYYNEEDKTNKYHLRKRRKIIQNVEPILFIHNLIMDTDNIKF